jgi:hypothetical protein
MAGRVFIVPISALFVKMKLQIKMEVKQKYVIPSKKNVLQRQCELLPSLGVHRMSSIDFSHFNLLL